MKSLILVVISLIFSSSLLHASDRVRNGGDFVRCANSPQSIYFYDYYELVKIQNKSPIWPTGKSDPFDIAQQIIQRQSDKNKKFKDLMLTYLIDMKQNMYFHNVELEPINDNPNYIIKSRCVLLQAAISFSENNKWQYHIESDAWEGISNYNKTMLILHEIIYRFASEKGQRTSTAAKKLNHAFLLSGDGWTDEKYIFNLRRELDLLLPEEEHLF